MGNRAQQPTSEIAAMFADAVHGVVTDREEDKVTAEQVEQLREDVARLERKIDLIFGDHVLINGRFVQTGKLKK